MDRYDKIIIYRICAAAAALLAAYLLAEKYISLALYLAAYLTAGYDVLYRAAKNLVKGRVLGESFLMGIATVGAFVIGQYAEGVAVMLFYQIGEFFQQRAQEKSRKSIAALMDIRPDYANLKVDGALSKVNPAAVKKGDIIVIKAGERVPLDCVIIEGGANFDTSAITGESLPKSVSAGGEILSGYVNLNAAVTAKVLKEYGESTATKILDLVENAAAKKSRSERFITRFARYYTPAVVAAALIIGVAIPLAFEIGAFDKWLYRALTFFVISCPCALVISIPLSFFGGIGGASKKGILIKGGGFIEALAKTELVAFDKTGTLTKGVFEVAEISPRGMSREELLKLAAHAEYFSNHPIAQSIRKAYGKNIDNSLISKAEDIGGYGSAAVVGGKKVAVGSGKFMEKLNIPYYRGELYGAAAHVAVDGEYAGYITVADEIKPDAAVAIKALKAVFVKQTAMLTGDSAANAKKVAEKLGIDKVYAELTPQDKIEVFEKLYAEKSRGKVVFVGDGINDAPVLARADVGIAMGGLGSDAAIEAADAVIMTDQPSKIAEAVKISRRTLGIARQNIIFSIGVKVLFLALSALGVSTMWEAIFADVGVTVLVTLNSFRALNAK